MSIIEKLGITKGPWYVMESGFSKRGNSPTVYATNNDLNFVAKCCDFATIDPVDNLANARLIAAAPDMLNALINDSFYAYDTDMDNPMFKGNPPIKHKTVIEKATGRTWEEIKELVQ